VNGPLEAAGGFRSRSKLPRAPIQTEGSSGG